MDIGSEACPGTGIQIPLRGIDEFFAKTTLYPLSHNSSKAWRCGEVLGSEGVVDMSNLTRTVYGLAGVANRKLSDIPTTEVILWSSSSKGMGLVFPPPPPCLSLALAAEDRGTKKSPSPQVGPRGKQVTGPSQSSSSSPLKSECSAILWQ